MELNSSDINYSNNIYTDISLENSQNIESSHFDVNHDQVIQLSNRILHNLQEADRAYDNTKSFKVVKRKEQNDLKTKIENLRNAIGEFHKLSKGNQRAAIEIIKQETNLDNDFSFKNLKQLVKKINKLNNNDQTAAFILDLQKQGALPSFNVDKKFMHSVAKVNTEDVTQLSQWILDHFQSVDRAYKKLNYSKTSKNKEHISISLNDLNIKIENLRKCILEFQNLSKSGRRAAIDLINQRSILSGGAFEFDNLNEYAERLFEIDPKDLVASFIKELKMRGSPSLALPSAAVPTSNMSVTILCPLVVDGMGDMGIAQNALKALKDSLGNNVNARLVVLVAAPHAHNPAKQQRETALKMKGEDPRIEIIEVPFELNKGGPGNVDLCTAEDKTKLTQILSQTDVLLNLPVLYDYLPSVKQMMEPEARIIVGTEYGLQEITDEYKLQGVEWIRSGPLQALYLDEESIPVEKALETCCNDPDIRDVLPTIIEKKDPESRAEAYRSYIENNNIAMFYLSKMGSIELMRSYLEQYLITHHDDKRDLHVMAISAPEHFIDESYLKKLKKDFGFDSIIIHKNGKPQEAQQNKKGKKALHIYLDYRFKPDSFKALSVLCLLSSKNYPNMFFVSGDGSFSDALSLMTAYSAHPEEANSVASIPVFIPRLSYHKNSIAQLIKLSAKINEPVLVKLFESLRDIEKLSSTERKQLALLSKSCEVKVALGRLSKALSEEHNLSRFLRDFILREQVQIIASLGAQTLPPPQGEQQK